MRSTGNKEGNRFLFAFPGLQTPFPVTYVEALFMRVLFLFDDYSVTPFSEGVLRLCEQWHAVRQVLMSAIAFGPPGPLEQPLNKLGIGTRSLPAQNLSDYLGLAKEGKSALFRKDRPDVLLAFCRWPAMHARLFHANNPYVPLMISLNEEPSSSRVLADKVLATFIERRTRSYFHRIIAPTESAAKMLRAKGIPPPRILLIRTGINAVESFPLAEFKKTRYRAIMGVAADALLLVTVSPVTESVLQRHIQIMEAILARAPNARLFLIGDTQDADAARRQITAAGLGNAITIVGPLTSILARVFSSADLYLQICNNNPAAFVEAQACETPVVAWQSEAASEFVINGETGVLVAGDDAATFADAVVKLLLDVEGRREMGSNARAFILDHHEVSTAADEYVKAWRMAAPESNWQTTTGSISAEELSDIRRDSLGLAPTPLPTRGNLGGKLS